MAAGYRLVCFGVFYSFILGFLTQCGPSTQIQTSDLSIYGGERVSSGEWDNTVALTDAEGIFCTGTAVSPTVIITAAHCLIAEKAYQGSSGYEFATQLKRKNEIRVYMGLGVQGGDISGQHFTERFGISPNYELEGDSSDHDIGYVILKTPLDLPKEKFANIALDAGFYASLKTGQSTRVVGFGRREGKKFGEKFLVNIPITSLGNKSITMGGGGRDACQGDSGGPAFARDDQGHWVLFAVTSQGDRCGKGGEWSLIYPDLRWLEQETYKHRNL